MSFVLCDNCRALNTATAAVCEGCALPLTATVAPETPILISGRYRLLGSLGRGGMGAVYKAHDRDLDEIVALKLLRPDLARTAELEGRFRSEIKLARRVAHRNVCRIFEYGSDGELRYISMELVDGTDLRRVLRTRGPLRGEDGVAVAVQIADGLRAIHEAGIIHRDLKTPNVMLDAKEAVKLMDFGIAKEWSPEPDGTTGGLMGTPEYMSPEQVLGERVDFRSDIYSFGIVLWELFEGDVPYRASTPGATLFKHLYDPSPFDDTARAAALPPAVAAICRRCLQRRPGDRFASAEDVLEALQQTYFAGKRKPRVSPSRGWQTMTLGAEILGPITAAFAKRRALRRLASGAAWGLGAVVGLAGAYWIGHTRSDTPGLAEVPRIAERMTEAAPTAAAPPSRQVVPATVPAVAPGAGAVVAAPAERAAVPTQNAAPPRMKVAASTPAASTSAAEPSIPEREKSRLVSPSIEAAADRGVTAAPTGPPAEPLPVAASRRSALPVLLTTLRTGSEIARAEAATSLGDMGAEAADAVPALSAALRDRDGHVRSMAARALGRIGAPARDAVPWLVDALRDKDERVRAAAAEALAPLSPAPSPTMEALAAALKDDSPRVRAMAAYGLGHFRDAPPKVVGALRKALKDDEVMVRRSAEAALAALGSPAAAR